LALTFGGSGVVIDEFCYSEVEKADFAAAIYENIAGLDIAMQYEIHVGVLDGIEHLQKELDSITYR
jgi:hypothetical protein